MSQPIIKAHQIGKQVATKQEQITILQDVSLEINQGESVAIVGTSGAGKTTLMTLLAGLSSPDQGSISLLGHDLNTMDDEARAQLRSESVGFVFQNFFLIPTLNALENVTLPNLIKGETLNIERAKSLLALVNLSHRENNLPSQLSGGEKQRVALARAFMSQPEVLFADEPTGSLDQNTAKKVVEQLFELNQRHGTTLVLVTHDLSLASQCQRVVHMEAGRIVNIEEKGDIA